MIIIRYACFHREGNAPNIFQVSILMIPTAKFLFITLSKDHVALRIGVSHFKSAPCLVWCLRLFCRWRYNVLICHMTSNDHLLEALCKFMGENSLWYVITLISLVTISIVKVEVCFTLSCDLS